jgi:hypothetical protein
MNTSFDSADGYQALVINRATGTYVSHHLKREDRELAQVWARCLAQTCRVELWHGDRLVGSFPPILNRTTAAFHV